MKGIEGFAAYRLTETDRVVTTEGEFEVEIKNNKFELKNDKGETKKVSLGFLKNMAYDLDGDNAGAIAKTAKEEEAEADKPKDEKPKAAAGIAPEKAAAKKPAAKAGKDKVDPVKAASEKQAKKEADAKAKTKAKEEAVKEKAKAREAANKWAQGLKKDDKITFTPFGKDKAVKGKVVRAYDSLNNPGSWYVTIKDGEGKKYDKVATAVMPKKK